MAQCWNWNVEINIKRKSSFGFSSLCRAEKDPKPRLTDHYLEAIMHHHQPSSISQSPYFWGDGILTVSELEEMWGNECFYHRDWFDLKTGSRLYWGWRCGCGSIHWGDTEWGEQRRDVEVGVGWGWGTGCWDGFEASNWAASLAGIGRLWKMKLFQDYQENSGFLLSGFLILQISLYITYPFKFPTLFKKKLFILIGS